MASRLSWTLLNIIKYPVGHKKLLTYRGRNKPSTSLTTHPSPVSPGGGQDFYVNVFGFEDESFLRPDNKLPFDGAFVRAGATQVCTH